MSTRSPPSYLLLLLRALSSKLLSGQLEQGIGRGYFLVLGIAMEEVRGDRVMSGTATKFGRPSWALVWVMMMFQLEFNL